MNSNKIDAKVLVRMAGLCLLLGAGQFVTAQLLDPGAFLAVGQGTRFTEHHRLVSYFRYVAENSDRVEVREYGQTHEKRPLIAAFISAPENLARLEEIRQANQMRAGLMPGTPPAFADSIVLVWISCSVHGNEPSGSEASMPLLFHLSTSREQEMERWLKNTVIILDPSLNPDGYARYTQWQNGVAAFPPDPDPDALEHQEPWPGGRANHYYFDLNRDWAWCTQVESQQRVTLYQQWLPQVHVDLHEMGPNQPYYFAPAAQPYHRYLSPFQASFQQVIGQNNARHFDDNGWLYFTREWFDLFYPSYGDTYPMFQGAIGMTYEQAGHAVSGTAILLENGDTLTLKQRIAHHLTSCLSTIEVSSRHAGRLVNEFTRLYRQNLEKPQGPYLTYVVRRGNDPGRIQKLVKLLDIQRIRYGTVGTTMRGLNGYAYAQGKDTLVQVETGDLVISAFQPHGNFVQALFDPESSLSDSLTYDITAWSPLFLFGLDAAALKTRILPTEKFEIKPVEQLRVLRPTYAYAWEWGSLSAVSLAADLMREGLALRVLKKETTIEGKKLARGTCILARGDNAGRYEEDLVIRMANRHQVRLTPLMSGMAGQGPDLGSSQVALLNLPLVALLGGEQTDDHAYGFVRHFFEQEIGYPVSSILPAQLTPSLLRKYNVLILPNGYYSFDSTTLENLKGWISDGGRLIAMGRALQALEDNPGFQLSRFLTAEAREAARKKSEEDALMWRRKAYADEDRRTLPDGIPGAILRLEMDATHPLSYGIGRHYFTLKMSGIRYPFLKNCWNVGVVPRQPFVSGFIGSRLRKELEETVTFAVQDMGRGKVLYLVDDPLFRGFLEQGKILFSNAVFLSGIR